MAIKSVGAAHTAPTRPGVDDDEVPDSIPRHGGDGRPKIRALDGSAKMSFYYRASGYGKVVESDYLLHRRDERNIVWGLSRRQDLVMAAGAVPVPRDNEDKIRGKAVRDELQRIAAEAKTASGADEAAMRGTELHKLSEQEDAGVDLSHLPEQVRAALGAWRRIMSGFAIHLTETFIVWDEFRIGGSFDRLLSPVVPMIAPDGTILLPTDRIIADLKSGATDDFFGAAYGVQQLSYACGVPYVHVSDEANEAGDTGRREWPDGIAPRTDWALIVHVPLEHPEDAGLLWVNLTDARTVVDAAVKSREAEKIGKGLYYPVEIPNADAPCACTRTVAEAEAGFDVTWSQACPVHWNDEQAREIGGWQEPAPTATPLQPAEVCPTHGAHPGTVDCIECLQDPILRAIAGATSVAAIGALYTAMSAKWTAVHGAAADARAAELEPAPAPAAEPAPAPPAVDEAALDLVLGQLAAAPDEAALDALYLAHQAAWTAEHTEVVKARLAELDGLVKA